MKPMLIHWCAWNMRPPGARTSVYRTSKDVRKFETRKAEKQFAFFAALLFFGECFVLNNRNSLRGLRYWSGRSSVKQKVSIFIRLYLLILFRWKIGICFFFNFLIYWCTVWTLTLKSSSYPNPDPDDSFIVVFPGEGKSFYLGKNLSPPKDQLAQWRGNLVVVLHTVPKKAHLLLVASFVYVPAAHFKMLLPKPAASAGKFEQQPQTTTAWFAV